ncbi:MAG TPA: TonB-dependent receptor plug domain-containing protein, partial [Sphingomicrobium sp.]|nr:TonB-dependent receptor plug domain-containing protein [Sphingomicrobium sp.]
MSNRYFRAALLGTTVIAGMAFTAPAFAQGQPAPTPTQPGQTSPAEEGPATAPDPNTTENPVPSTTGQATATGQATQEGDEIVVTGSILRRTNTETPSPVTVLSSESLAQRGINTAAEAVQRVSANNAGTIQAGWNTGFNFASGANAPALRGLTVQNTLSIFDGLRMAAYPLADDGQRNFVDLNTIPNAIIDRVEVLRDGASSTYGADAIAGVVNIITKKEIQGLHIGASAGISQRGDAGEQRLDVTWGHGDLDEDGFNFYVSAEYQNQEELWARDRGFPFNTQDLSSICNSDGACMSNLNWNGISQSGAYNGNISIPNVAWVRPQSAPGSATGAGQWAFLNPAAGCRGFPEVHPVGVGSVPILNGVPTSCEVNQQEEFIMLSPDIERKGATARVTVNVGDNHQVYAMGTYYRTDTFASFTPLGFNGTPTPPIPATLGAYNVMQPVYVCPTGVGTRTGTNTGCTAATPGAILNPYNPFAANGQTAQMFVRSTRPRSVETNTRALRGVLGVSGTIFDDVRYSTDFVASEVSLKRIQAGYLIPQRIMDAVARGEINFFDLEATPENVWDFISPTQKVTSVSKLWQWQGTLAKDLMDLPGGPLQAAVGVQYRQESI